MQRNKDITVVSILKNGDFYPYIECYEAVEPYFENIIVMIDGEKEIENIKKISDRIKIIPFTWNEIEEGYLSIAKYEQEAIQYANTEWILKVQANEFYLEKDTLKMFELIKNTTANGFIFYFLHFVGLNKNILFPAYNNAVRLFRKDKGKSEHDGWTVCVEGITELTDIKCYRYYFLTREQMLLKAEHHYKMYKMEIYRKALEDIKNGKLPFPVKNYRKNEHPLSIRRYYERLTNSGSSWTPIE